MAGHTRTRMRLVPMLLGTVLLIFGASCYAADVTLAWDPNTESDLSAYGIYFKKGSDGPPYDLFGYVDKSELSDASSPSFTVTGLQRDSVYYFAVTAVDASDEESSYSASVCAQVGAVVTACDATGSTASSSAGAGAADSTGGGGGGGCFIQAAGSTEWPAVVMIAAGVFNLTLVGIAAAFRRRRNPEKIPVNLEAFCAGLSRDIHIPDPYVLLDDEWVCQDECKRSAVRLLKLRLAA